MGISIRQRAEYPRLRGTRNKPSEVADVRFLENLNRLRSTRPRVTIIQDGSTGTALLVRETFGVFDWRMQIELDFR